MKTQINIGDLFSFDLGNLTIYFQYLGSDSYQLNSDCIAIFNYVSDKNVTIDAVIDSGIWFVTLTWIKPGIKEKFYKKVGTFVPLIDPNKVQFKSFLKDYVTVRDNEFYTENIYYIRNLGSKQLVRQTKEEFDVLPNNIWDDGASYAEGQKEYILHKLYGRK